MVKQVDNEGKLGPTGVSHVSSDYVIQERTGI